MIMQDGQGGNTSNSSLIQEQAVEIIDPKVKQEIERQ